jgi:hypothetical protein
VASWSREAGDMALMKTDRPHRCARGLVTIDQLWTLATTWYSTRLQENSRCPQSDEMRSIFDSLSLGGDLWDPQSVTFQVFTFGNVKCLDLTLLPFLRVIAVTSHRYFANSFCKRLFSLADCPIEYRIV